MPSTHKALLYKQKGGDLVVDDVETYKPGPGELLIKVHATSLNPVDWKIHRTGVFGVWLENYPAIVGTDIAGDVEEVGEGVTDFKKGDRVFGQGKLENDGASFQQYTVCLAATTAKIPANVTYDQAAALPVVLSCTWVALYNKQPHGLGITPPSSEATQGIYSGTPIAIIGGASSVGQLAIQFAKLSGFSPIIATASPKHTNLLKSLGATHVLDRNLPVSTLVEESNRITEGKPIKYVYDTISGESTQKAGIEILAPGGHLAVVLPPAVPIPEGKNIIVTIGLLRFPSNIEHLETLYHDVISKLLEKGLIKPNNIEVLPNGLAGIAAGLDRMAEDSISGLKLVAHPQETQ